MLIVSKWENPGGICKAEEKLVGILLRQKSEDEFSFKNFYWSIVDLQCCISSVQQSESVIDAHTSILI